MEKIDSQKGAALLNDLNKQIEAHRRTVEASLRAEPGKRTIANRAAQNVSSLRNTLRTWYGYYNSYDPMFTWWVEEPYKAVDQSACLGAYVHFLRNELPDCVRLKRLRRWLRRAAVLDVVQAGRAELVAVADNVEAWVVQVEGTAGGGASYNSTGRGFQ